MKAQRVVTVYLQAAGGKSDRGEVGFEPGSGRQFLVFPKSLRAYTGHVVIGIKYELIASLEAKSKPAPEPKRSHAKWKAKPAARSETKPQPASSKIVPFEMRSNPDEGEVVTEFKRRIRHAMALPEKEKAVAAFNPLKRLVE